MSVRVNDFKYIPGKNDAEYIKLLKEDLERQKQITNKAIAKIKELSNCSEFPRSAEPEPKPISYMECANAMLKMWIGNVLTDGEYNRIMDKLNSKHMADMRGDNR